MTESDEDAREILPGILKIIGIGQSLRGDDAAGLAAVSLWIEKHPRAEGIPTLQVELAELPGIGLLNLLQGIKYAIVVDAVHSQAKPGTIHRLSLDQLSSFRDGAGSAHGWGVAESLSLGSKLMPGSLPQDIVVIGIEAGDLSLGVHLSPEVENALPEAVRMIDQLLLERNISTS